MSAHDAPAAVTYFLRYALAPLVKVGCFRKNAKTGWLVVYKKLSVQYRKEQAPSLRLVAGINKVCPHLTSAFASARYFACAQYDK